MAMRTNATGRPRPGRRGGASSLPDRGAVAEGPPFEIRPDPHSRLNRDVPFSRNVVHTKTKNRDNAGIGPNFPAAADENLDQDVLVLTRNARRSPGPRR